MLAPAPVVNTDPARPVLDTKFVSGMIFTCANWPGRIDCILRNQTSHIPFGAQYSVSDLPFGLQVIDPNDAIDPALLEDYDVIELSGDMHHDLDLPSLAKKRKLRAQFVFVIEYTLETRLQIIGLDRDLSALRKARSALWTIRQERRRRQAMRICDAVQTNGYPAYDSYQRLNPDTLLYLDNRMRDGLFASDVEMAARRDRHARSMPLRLINSGRLEVMKGAQDLIPFAAALRDIGTDFTLDIYGTGSLENEIRSAIVAENLEEIVNLHAPVDFETELVPLSRTTADVFVSFNRQSDPSCTYLEAMGCGLPIVGYANSMLKSLVQTSRAGWTVPMGNIRAMATLVSTLAERTKTVPRAAANALAYARAHSFENEFLKRQAHRFKVGTN
jgi:glycosyltransferase involved in cell wall biosynthesis